MTASPALEASKLTRRFGGVTTLEDVSVSTRPGRWSAARPRQGRNDDHHPIAVAVLLVASRGFRRERLLQQV